MNLHRSRGFVAAILCSAVLTAACGLKPEVKDSLAQGGGVAAGGGQVAVDTDGDGVAESFVDAGTGAVDGGAVDPATGEVTGGTDTTGGTGTTGGGGGEQTTTTTTGGGGGGGETTTTGGDAAAPTQEKIGPDSKVGVDDKKKTLKISLHGPLTGAGVPQDSFKSGTPKYWNEGNNGKPVLVKGYRVIAEAFDDKYQPGPAVKACNQHAKTDFLIVGGAGTDQIQACARSSVLARGNVPYLSAGVTENGLQGLNTYFATSLSYRQQGKLVVEMAKKGGYLKPKNGKGWAMVISNTPNFLDAEQGFLEAMKPTGVPIKVIRTPKSGADSTSVANQLREGQFESVYFLGQPLFFIELVGKAGCPAYCPQWAGPGVSMGTNSIGRPACQASGGQYKGEFLNPSPGLDMAGKVAPGVSFKDDIEFGIWGSMELLAQILNKVPGEGFTRERFIAGTNGKAYAGGVFPKVSFAKGRFGGSGAYALKSDCSDQMYNTNGFYTI
jgi:branched-chain amino acid transport system substrate-binding protein